MDLAASGKELKQRAFVLDNGQQFSFETFGVHRAVVVDGQGVRHYLRYDEPQDLFGTRLTVSRSEQGKIRLTSEGLSFSELTRTVRQGRLLRSAAEVVATPRAGHFFFGADGGVVINDAIWLLDKIEGGSAVFSVGGQSKTRLSFDKKYRLYESSRGCVKVRLEHAAEGHVRCNFDCEGNGKVRLFSK